MTPVAQQDIPRHWEWIERGLVEILRRTREKWSPAHVSQALYEGRAGLFICEDGFIVLQQQREDWTCAPVVNVWAMWFKPGMAREREEEIRNWLDDITQKQVRMGSPRKGWGRMLGPGWEIETITYRRKKT